MDLSLLIAIATALLVVLIGLYFFNRKQSGEKKEPARDAPAGRGQPVRLQEGVPRRAQIARNQRNRARVVADDDEEQPDDAGDGDGEKIDFGDAKIGAKKRAKLEAKAEKKKQREAEQQMREEQKKKDALADEERRKLEEMERLEEQRKEEAERKAREEKERRDHEEYLKLKAAFSVEEEGFEAAEEEEENLLQNFIDYVKEEKVVVLEDLAAHFKLKVQATIDRILQLKEDGQLSGVIDDRGKFIYISEEELAAVAKFIRQRGRVSISELAESSNRLINLRPVKTTN